MLNDFVATCQLVDELVKLRRAYSLLESVHVYTNTTELTRILREVSAFFSEREY